MSSDGLPGVRDGDAYLHPLYASSFSEFGQPQKLPRCGGWLLRRQIPGADATDATGCYPLFACRDWSRLGEDLEHLEDLVSLVLVTDPFGDFDLEDLGRHFDDVRVFKPHYVIDLSAPVASRHHRYYARRALRELEIERQSRPADLLDEWTALYAVLVKRKGLRGIQAFSRDAFAMQLELPGVVMLVARLGGEVVGADWYYVDGQVAYRPSCSLLARGLPGERLVRAPVAGDRALGGARRAVAGHRRGARGSRAARRRAAAVQEGLVDTNTPDVPRNASARPSPVRKLSSGAGSANGYFPAYRAMELT